MVKIAHFGNVIEAAVRAKMEERRRNMIWEERKGCDHSAYTGVAHAVWSGLLCVSGIVCEFEFLVGPFHQVAGFLGVAFHVKLFGSLGDD